MLSKIIEIMKLTAGDHPSLLQAEAKELQTVDGLPVSIWELAYASATPQAWSNWARHFRSHYCSDELIDILKAGTPYESSRAEYLNNLVFPDTGSKFGPSVRAGDFAEVLVADLLEHKLAYWVPRTRYGSKQVRDESPKGVDIIGIRFAAASELASPHDELITVETKAQFSGRKAKARLQDAVVDSVKDEFRKGESLNAIKRRLIEQGEVGNAKRVERFQDQIKNSYVDKVCAAALFCNSVYSPADIVATTNCSEHPRRNSLSLMVIRADSFMDLVNTIYKKAADEA